MFIRKAMESVLKKFKICKIAPNRETSLISPLRSYLCPGRRGIFFPVGIDVEIWKSIPSYEGKYEISSHGNIRRAPWVNCFGSVSHGYLRKPYVRRGYKVIGLNFCGKRKKYHVHILVAKVFIGDRPHGMEIRHLDGNKLNNHISNLQYGTPKENGEDRVKHNHSPRGVRNGFSKLSNNDVLEIRRLRAEGYCRKFVADMFGINVDYVSEITANKRWGWLNNEE